MNWTRPTDEELAGLRADPLIFEQELDIRPEIAVAIEQAVGFRAGAAAFTRSNSAISDAAGRRWRLSMASGTVSPRPVDNEIIDRDLEELMLWLAEAAPQFSRSDVEHVIVWAWKARSNRPPAD